MDMLGQMADGVARRHRDRSGVLMLFPEDHAEERGFAVTVPPDETDTLAGIDGEADAVEQRLLAVGFFYVRDLEHGMKPLCGERVYYRKYAGEANKKISGLSFDAGHPRLLRGRA